MKRVVVVLAACMIAGSCAQKPPAPEPPPSAPTPPPAAPAPSPPSPPPARVILPPDSPPPGTPAAKSRAQTLVRQAFELLDQGEEDRAKTAVEQAAALDPENKSAACLLRGIRADPVSTLGRESTSYSVRPGDTLGSIAKRALGDTCEFYILARYNQIRVPRQLAAGQVIRIPGKVPLSEEVARPTPAPRTPSPRAPEATKPEPPQVATPSPPSAPPDSAPPALSDAQKTRALIEQHYRNGQAAYSRQDLNTAIREWDKVLELDPGNELAKARREQAVALQKRLKELPK
jgi:tetratricopeptide (TPR) repeat protein